LRSRKIAIVGAGHNALVCACYLAKAGHDVTVYERRHVVGGAVNTEELWPSYRVDTCSVMHILIHKTPILEELGLHRFGLEYMQMDPWGFAPFPDGSHILFYRDLDRTCRSIASISERDAEAYRAFILSWNHINRRVFDLFNAAPTPGAAASSIAKGILNGITTNNPKSKAHVPSERPKSEMGGPELLRKVVGSYGKLLDETFTSPRVKAAVAWMAAQSGPPPTELGAGDLAGAQSLYHDVGATRPRGGSGMLAQALTRCLEHHGGSVRLNTPVSRIVTSGGRVRGLELEGGERVEADLVVSGAHVQTTLLGLVGGEELPSTLRAQVEALRVGTGTGMTLRCAVEELPAYNACAPSHGSTAAECHHSMQLICPSMDYLQKAYDDAQRGYPAQRPALVAMTPSAVDPSITPPGKHSLYIWAQYHPYTLSNGETWDGIREREADRLLETLAEYAPNIAGCVTHRYIQTPLDLERNVGLPRGNIMHIDMSLDQMFLFRPVPALARYRTPIEGLYLTGASTHPGGGVSGASGRNAASAVLADLASKRRVWPGVALAGAVLAGRAFAARRRK
jgi:phytoene dehydrogenase-like protein